MLTVTVHVFSLSFFRSDQFKSIQRQIEAAEDKEMAWEKEHQQATNQSRAQGDSPLLLRFDNTLARHLSPMKGMLSGLVANHQTQSGPAAPGKSTDGLPEHLINPTAVAGMMGLNQPSDPKRRKPKTSVSARVAETLAAQGDNPILYVFQPASTVTKLWEEFTVGLTINGKKHPSIRELNENYGKKWRRCKGGALRDAYWWRNVIYSAIVDLIEVGGCAELAAVDQMQKRQEKIHNSLCVQKTGRTRKPEGVLRALVKELVSENKAKKRAREESDLED
jgi:hypothetical protein